MEDHAESFDNWENNDWDAKDEEKGYVLFTEYFGDDEEEELFHETSRAYEHYGDMHKLMNSAMRNKANKPRIKLMRFWVSRDTTNLVSVYEARRVGKKFWHFMNMRHKRQDPSA